MKLKMKLFLSALIILSSQSVGIFAQSNSTNYSVDETFIGPGGQLDSSSANFEAKASLGDTGVGNSESSNFQARGGFTTTDQEYLEVEVNGGTYDLGELTDTSTAAITATFSVRNYVTHGYVVQLVGSAPKNGGHELAPMTTRGVSSQGTEQFGVNLRNNTAPNIGADITQFPDATFGFGVAATDYGVVDEFKYIPSEIIALSSTASGQTNYTLSLIANVSSTTPGGIYSGRISIVVCSTF